MPTEEKLTSRQEQAIETRQRLMEAALQLFAQKGYADTRVRDINRSLDLADGILYHYFPGGKDELLQTLITEKFERVASDLMQKNWQQKDGSLEEVLERLFVNIDEVIQEHLPILKIIFSEAKNHELIDLQVVMALFLDRQSWFPSYLRQKAETGEIREMDYECATEFLRAVVVSHLFMKLADIETRQLSDPVHRKRLIEYQVSLWRNPQP